MGELLLVGVAMVLAVLWVVLARALGRLAIARLEGPGRAGARLGAIYAMLVLALLDLVRAAALAIARRH